MDRAYSELLEAAHLVVLILHLNILIGRDVSRRGPIRVDYALPRHAARVGCSPRLFVYLLY